MEMVDQRFLQCKVALAAMRSAPDDRAELETQVLYGEQVKLLQSGEGDWVEIQLGNEDYTGWVDQKLFSTAQEEEGAFLLTEMVALVQLGIGGQQWLGFGSKMDTAVKQINPSLSLINRTVENDLDIVQVAKRFLGAPYLWGGKSVMGIDCSGFSQLVMEAKGVWLPRNASRQVLSGHSVDFANRQTGDLAFFTTKSDKITHVGIIIPEGIIHAHGEVRIDELTIDGIYNQNKGLITHKLDCIKRVF